jgi:hypothetical protein
VADPAVADAVKAVITGLTLTPTPSVVTRKRLLLLDGDTFPLVVVSAGDGVEAEVVGRQAAGVRRVHKRYPVSVALAFKNQGTTGENATLRGWLDAIDTAMLNWADGLAANGLPGVNEVESRGRSTFDPAAFAAGYDQAESWYEVEVAQDV